MAQEAKDWENAAGLAAQRTPHWKDLQLLLDHARNLPVAEEVRPQVDAVRDQRCLLSDPDPVPPLCDKLTQALREALKEAHQAYAQTQTEERQRLIESEPWQKLPEDERPYILRQQGIVDEPSIQVGTEQEVLTTLEKTPLGGWQDQRDALPTRFDKARMEAARRLEPKAVSMRVPAATLRNEEDVDLWLDVVRDTIVQRLKDGPVIIS